MSFDYYLLAYSYAPEFCRLNPDKKDSPECTGSYGLVLHGMWPQYLKGGYPEFCNYPEKYTKQDLDTIIKNIDGWEDIAPEYMDLVEHEWTKHGTCSELSPKEYFELVFNIAKKYYVNIPKDCNDIPSLFDKKVYKIVYDNSGDFSGVEVKVDKKGNILDL